MANVICHHKKFGRRGERMITDFLENLDQDYIVFRNETELGPVDLILLNFKTFKTAFVDCKSVKKIKNRDHGIKRHKKYGDPRIWRITYNTSNEIRIIVPGSRSERDEKTGQFTGIDQQKSLQIFKNSLK